MTTQTKAAHTPGPWTLNDDPDNAYVTAKRAGASGAHVIATITQLDKPYYPAKDESASNARLISASPDLLQALEGMISACEALGEYICSGVPNNQQRKADAAIEHARAAIRKARGEA